MDPGNQKHRKNIGRTHSGITCASGSGGQCVGLRFQLADYRDHQGANDRSSHTHASECVDRVLGEVSMGDRFGIEPLEGEALGCGKETSVLRCKEAPARCGEGWDEAIVARPRPINPLRRVDDHVLGH